MIFLFPGQGSQHVGMAQAFVQAYPVARATLEEADDLLGFNLSHLCFEGPEESLTDTINAQPALLATSIATLRVLESELGADTLWDNSRNEENTGSSVRFVAGHSMGEYSALVGAGSIDYSDGLRLLRERGRLMKEAGEQQPGMMAAVLGLDEEKVADVCAESTAQGGVAQVANDNCPGQVVISGDAVGMESAMSALQEARARKVVQLAVSIAAHSPLMAPAEAELRSAIEGISIVAPRVPVIANMNAEPMETAEAIRTELVSQLTGSVRWATSMRYALGAGVTHFVEVGPDDVLTKMMKRIDRKATRMAVNDPDSLAKFAESLSKNNAT